MNILIKIAAAAWREELRLAYNTPAYEPLRKRLIAAGILDPDAEVEKLHRAGKAMAEKRGLTTKDVKPTVGPGKRARSNRRALLQSQANLYTKKVTASSGSPLGKVLQAHEGFETLTADTPKGKAREKVLDAVRGHTAEAKRKAKRLNLLGAHREMKKRRAALKADLPKVVPKHFYGHMDPSVLARESQTVPFLPKRVQKAMEATRKLTGEAQHFTRAGMRYGSTPKVTKKVVKALGAVKPSNPLVQSLRMQVRTPHFLLKSLLA